MNMKTILIALCLGTSVVAAGVASAEDAVSFAADSNGSKLTRAEVEADLEMWERAGLSKYTNSEAGADPSDPAYLAALEKYRNLRNSEAYAEEVRHIASLRGELSAPANGG